MTNNNKGFTLIEILIVIVILSIMILVAVPRITTFFNTERESTAITTALIVKTFDDSFLTENINYLSIHLYDPWQQEEPPPDSEDVDMYSRRNAISVLRLVDGKFIQHNKNTLKPRVFPDSFRFEEVVLSTGEIIKNGNVLVPFYPAGFSDNIILHILVNNSDKISIKIRKFLREPVIASGYAEFDEVETGV